MTEKELYQQWLEHATEDADLQTELKESLVTTLRSVTVFIGIWNRYRCLRALSVQAPIV